MKRQFDASRQYRLDAGCRVHACRGHAFGPGLFNDKAAVDGETTVLTPSCAWNAMVDAADVELGIAPTGRGDLHAVTLTGLAFDDLDGDGWWDAGEEPKEIGYLDPNSVSASTWADVTIDPEVGRIEFPWSQNAYYVYRVFTEGPDLVPGDANADGVVDDADASILRANWRSGNATWEMGDFNRDHNVDDRDAAILAAHWEYDPDESTSSAAPTSTALPEPSALLLLISMLAWLSVARTIPRRGRSCTRNVEGR